jgi:transketolase
MMGMAAGIASTGKRVFVYSIANFPTLRCIEQIRNEVSLMNNPVVVVSVGAGYSYGSQGYTHHALEDVAMLRALPNMNVILPCDPIETEKITEILADSREPAYFRLGKSNEKIIHKSEPEIETGNFLQLKSGKKGTLLAAGSVASIALEAAEQIDVNVFSVPFVSKIDIKHLSKLTEIGPIVTIEEHSYRGGFGSSVLEFAARSNLKARIGLVASEQNNLSQIGSQEFLRNANGITVENIVSTFNQL